jgi:peptide/nickel transport system permease protein
MRLLRRLLNAFNPFGQEDAFFAGLAWFRALLAVKIVYGLVLFAGGWVNDDPLGHWIGRGGVPYFSLSLLVFTLLPLPWHFLVKRLLLMLLTLWASTLVAFFVIQAAPGDFTAQYRLNPQFSEEALQAMVKRYGFDKPVIEQYGRWLWRAVAYQDFGVSTKYINEPVFKLIRTRMLATLRLALLSLVLVWLISLPVGIYSAIRQYSLGDKVLSVLTFIGMSLPTFFVAFLLLYFATSVDWLPAGGLVSPNYDAMSGGRKILDYLWHMIIPVAVLTISSLAGMVRLMRGNMLEVKRAQYVTTARAKGLSEPTVIYKHMLRNAINPMVTIFGYQLSGLLSGVALTEAVLAYPGLGRLILDGVLAQDLYLVMASMVMGTTLLLLGNLIADLLLVLVDPRIQVQ